MRDLNSVILIGNLTKTVGEDEKSFGYLQNGTAVAKFSIAVNRSKKDMNGQWVDEANFFNITYFGKMAESIKPYLTKGTKIAVEGELNQSKWTDNQGVNHTMVGILANSVQLLGKRESQNNESQSYPVQQNQIQQNQNFGYTPQPQNNQMMQNNNPFSGGYQQTNGYDGGSDFPEDIPF